MAGKPGRALPAVRTDADSAIFRLKVRGFCGKILLIDEERGNGMEWNKPVSEMGPGNEVEVFYNDIEKDYGVHLNQIQLISNKI